MESYDKAVRVAAVQAAPVWLDADATVTKAIGFIADARARGAELIAFPELYAPGYPFFTALWKSNDWLPEFLGRYQANSLTLDDAPMRRLAAAAAEHRMVVAMGYSERDGASLYMSQVIYGSDGEVLANRRKLKPTFNERTLFGEGDGSDVTVVSTPLGRVGALQCWEHLQPLLRYAMYDMHEQIHISAWPPIPAPEVPLFGLTTSETIARMHAIEGQCFSINATSFIDAAGQALFCRTDEERAQMRLGGGWARVYAPNGADVAEPLPSDEEGILVADVDLRLIPFVKVAADPVGHYSRPDVFSLQFDARARARVQRIESVVPTAPARQDVVGELDDTSPSSPSPVSAVQGQVAVP